MSFVSEWMKEWYGYHSKEYRKAHPKPEEPKTDDPEAKAEYEKALSKWGTGFAIWCIEHAGEPLLAEKEEDSV